jgi:hypothetical protein
MIKIVKDNNEKVVTKGAYENFYKPLGYEIVKDQPTKIEKTDVKPVIEVNTKKDEAEKKTSKAVEYKKR